IWRTATKISSSPNDATHRRPGCRAACPTFSLGGSPMIAVNRFEQVVIPSRSLPALSRDAARAGGSPRGPGHHGADRPHTHWRRGPPTAPRAGRPAGPWLHAAPAGVGRGVAVLWGRNGPGALARRPVPVQFIAENMTVSAIPPRALRASRRRNVV